jgi:hypothetical protein
MHLPSLSAALILVSVSAHAQLFDPNQHCFIDQSGHCATPIPQGSYPAPPPQENDMSCAGQCKQAQDICMSECQQSDEFYSCFARCGDQHTMCMHDNCGE